MFTILGADGKEYGPVTAGKLHEWVTGGRANLQTKAKREGEADWKTLGDFPEFSQFGQTSGPAAAVIPPPVPSVTSAAPVVADTGGLELASRWLRLGAAVLDSIIGGFFCAPGFVMLMMAGIFSTPDSPNPALLLAGGVTLCLGLVLLLGIQIYLLVTRGQTMGKKLLGIRIVSFEDESNPGFVKVFLLRMLVNGVIGAVPFIGVAYSLIDILFIFRDDRRCIHDLIAGTKVVKA
jgi:uncharacterized RDD family membrane protein YckC